MEITKKYAVVKDTEYYAGDCQHPSGWHLDISSIHDTLNDAREESDRLNAGPVYLSHGEAGSHYDIYEVDDDNADYQSWLDAIDWKGCPSDDGSDYDANCAWAENRAYARKSSLPVSTDDGRIILISYVE